MTLERRRPRFVEVRRLADGSVAFYFCIPKYYRKLGCEIVNEPLGTSYEAACGEHGKGGRATALNALFDEWNDQRKGEPLEQAKIARRGADEVIENLSNDRAAALLSEDQHFEDPVARSVGEVFL